MRGFPIVSAFVTMLILAPACADEPPRSIFQPLDFERPEGDDSLFNPNEIIDNASFADEGGITREKLQAFLRMSPYDRPSFLETYQSNGVPAVDAIVGAARAYHVNPLVFVVFAQMTQGLVGERNYPQPPNRVEYVFGCGCFQDGNCLPELAGFDRQVECLGRELARAFVEVHSDQKQTTRGWGPNKESTTLDGVKVTPTNEVTAVIYDRTPYVSERKAGGSWMFWNLFGLYAIQLGYHGPSKEAGWIGEPCTGDESCADYAGGFCALNFPSGYCTASCTGQCPKETDRPPAFCGAVEAGGFCFRICDPAESMCDEGYTCKRLARFGAASEGEDVCYPVNPP